MTTQPQISVLIPVHNQEKFVGRCLRSLLAQTLRRDAFELIVIDDGSRDRTPYALELFRDDITLVVNDTRRGLPHALNCGLKQVRSPFVVRVDSDDYVNKDFLSILHLFLSSNPHMDAVACDYLTVDDQEQVLARQDCLTAPIGCGIMFRTAQLFDIGLYDEQFLRHEERDLRIRFEQKFRIHRIELPLYRYRKHDSNITNDEAAMALHLERLIAKHSLKLSG